MHSFVFFGASGDLFAKKLAPALGRLFVEERLPQNTRVIGVSRKPWSDDEFRDRVASFAQGIPRENIFFVTGDVTDDSLPQKLASVVSAGSVTLYLSLSPVLYEAGIRALHQTIGLMGDRGHDVRILIEKPFGRNTREAEMLNALIDETVGEECVFRIDHYIQKESVQNILAYRFSNELLANVWSGKATARVSAFILEDTLLSGRGDFYDATGALNDVVQNHALELLAATLMDNPNEFSAEKTRAARTEVISRLRIAPTGHTRGQYEGYRQVPGVSADSETETFVRLALLFDHPDWQGIPITIEAGKGLLGHRGGVQIGLKQAGARICFDEECSHEDVFEFLLAPEERTSLHLWGKKPGVLSALTRHSLTFSFQESFKENYTDRAYDRVLFDAYRKDATRFVAREESMAAWRFADEARAALTATPLVVYKQGSDSSVIS
ncbi:MAG: hypothetical protein KBD16_03270 [Candidatus Pacebacteria bacterium]|nr:hypothetical protein [Candidatus Paceibacterota bacterium]